jgi:formylmethanofuran dehydrogenase subunit E
MKCKGCSIDLTGVEYRDVAEWHFCLDCFQRLMAGVEPDKETHAPETANCLICHVALEPGQGQQMLGMVFCDRCKEALMLQPEIRLGSVPAVDPPESAGVEQVAVDLRKTVHCHGCQRQIPQLGSKQVDGKNYCPDCFKPLVVQGKTGATAKQQTLCQACLAPIIADDARIVDGFSLCSACLATDRTAALKIARARHRQQLERIEGELHL